MKVLVDGQTLATPDIRRGIGRVLIELCEEMLPSDRSTDWFFAVDSHGSLAGLGEEAQRFAVPLQVSSYTQERDRESRSRAYSAALSRLCSENEIDVYWNPNPLMLNVALPLELTGVRKVCTVHDLIPLMMNETYRETWPRNWQADYDMRVRSLPSWADHLAFNSEASRADYVSIDGRVESRSSVIHFGVDHSTFWSLAAPRRISSPPYVLVVGGADPRKNIARAIVAFADARSQSPRLEDLRLKIVAGGSDQDRRRLSDIAKTNGVADKVRLFGYVDDSTLANLYRRAAAFFFPSLYEGFGFPVLEAMACGVPVVISDRAALRECAGEWGTFCDPTSVPSMSEALVKVLLDKNWQSRDKAGAVNRARTFDWSQSAARYVEMFQRNFLKPAPAMARLDRQRIAWVSPWPPDKTGVADYSAGLVEALDETMQVDLFLENPADAECSSGRTIYSIEELSHRAEDYDQIIYHLGNNSDFHSKIYRLAWEIPGVVVLHDINIHPFLHHAYSETEEEWLYRDALVEAHGRIGLDHFEAVREASCDPDIWNFPLSEAIARRSRAVIVHSAWAREALGKTSNVFVVPLFAPLQERRSTEEGRRVRESLGLSADVFSIGVFGFLNRSKRIPAVIEACAQMREQGYPVELVLVGAKNDPMLELSSLIKKYAAESYTTCTGFVSEERYAEYLDAVDVVVNLRYPTMGESSLSLARAFGAGKACLVTDVGQFSEIPDSVCWKVEIGDSEVDQIVAYLEELLGNPDLRFQLGESARQFARNYDSPEKAAALYCLAIDSIGR